MPPPNPHVGFYGWQTLNLRIFLPPWYQQVLVQPEQTHKLPYEKFPYPTYVKDNDLDAHIKVFKKTIRTNGETMEVDIINLFNFTLQDIILEWGENFVQDCPNYTFDELEQGFCKCFRIVKNDEKVYV